MLLRRRGSGMSPSSLTFAAFLFLSEAIRDTERGMRKDSLATWAARVGAGWVGDLYSVPGARQRVR